MNSDRGVNAASDDSDDLLLSVQQLVQIQDRFDGATDDGGSSGRSDSNDGR